LGERQTEDLVVACSNQAWGIFCFSVILFFLIIVVKNQVRVKATGPFNKTSWHGIPP
jgi:hypothetical protein